MTPQIVLLMDVVEFECIFFFQLLFDIHPARQMSQLLMREFQLHSEWGQSLTIRSTDRNCAVTRLSTPVTFTQSEPDGEDY